MKKLVKLDPETALAYDFECFLMAPTPLADNANDEERDAFNVQLDKALATCDEKVKKRLDEIIHS